MNGEASTGRVGVQGLGALNEVCKTPKHERVDCRIDMLGAVLFKLEGLSSRISSEPPKPVRETESTNYSLEGHLSTAPERIDCFISAAESLIEQIEEKLF